MGMFGETRSWGIFGMLGKVLATAALLGLTVSASAANIDVTNVQVPYGLYNVVLTGGTLPRGVTL
jgi:hypothetical protein